MTADILLVDDNSIQATTRKAILSRLGRSVVLAGRAAQALDLLFAADSPHPVSLVITDHFMPEMNGPEFVAALRQHFPDIPVLVLSGMADAECEYDDLDVTFRVKPLPPDELLRLVQLMLPQPIARTA